MSDVEELLVVRCCGIQCELLPGLYEWCVDMTRSGMLREVQDLWRLKEFVFTLGLRPWISSQPLWGEITTVFRFKLFHSIQYLKLIDVSPSKPSFSSSYTRKVARFLNLPPLGFLSMTLSWALPVIFGEMFPCLREEVAGLGVWWFFLLSQVDPRCFFTPKLDGTARFYQAQNHPKSQGIWHRRTKKT